LSDLKFVSWKEILLKTLDETDAEKLARLVPEAELAMFKRRQELHVSPWSSEELSTMSVASKALRVVKRRIIKREVLGPSKGNDARFVSFVRRSGTSQSDGGRPPFSSGAILFVVHGRSRRSARHPATYEGAHPTTVTNALSQTTAHIYDFNSGRVTSTTDANSQPHKHQRPFHGLQRLHNGEQPQPRRQ